MSAKRLIAIPLAALLEIVAGWLTMLAIVVTSAYFLLETVATQESLRTQEARTQVALSQARDSIEASLGLGFSISELPRAQSLIETTLGKEPALLAIDVFDSQGTIRFSTDRGSIGEAAPDDWLKSRGQDSFSALAGTDHVLAIGLRGSFSEIEGYLVATYRPGASVKGDFWRLPAALALLSVLALLAATILLTPAWREVDAAQSALAGKDSVTSNTLSDALSRLDDHEQHFTDAFTSLEQENTRA